MWWVQINVEDPDAPRPDPLDTFVARAWKLVGLVVGVLVVYGVLDLLGAVG